MAVPYVHGEYFPHIDGIRALAVLPVVFYHTWNWLCPGGFAGVGVFFVISGSARLRVDEHFLVDFICV